MTPTSRTDVFMLHCDHRVGFAFAQLRTHANQLERELALATEAVAQREEELAAERRKNRELSLAIGKARELAVDAAIKINRVVDALPETTL